jgi:hypothetical protein
MRRFLSLLAAGLLLAGCAGPSHYDVATAPDQLVVRLEERGGAPPPRSWEYTHLPTLSLYGDGRIIHPGIIDGRMDFPGRDSTRPLLPDTWLVRITPDEIQRIVAAADEAGLLGPHAIYYLSGSEDWAGFTLVVGGKTYEQSGLSLIGGQVEDPTIQAARSRLGAFQRRLDDLGKFLGRSLPHEAYEPTAMRLFIGAADETTDTGGAARQVVDWPLAVDPATAGQPSTQLKLRCLAISGADLTAFMAVARTASEATIWTAASGRYSIMVRPLLPDESGCGTL